MCNENKRPVLKVGDKVISLRWGEGEVVCVLPKPTRHGHEVVIQISSGEITSRKKDGRSAGADRHEDFDKIPKKKMLYCVMIRGKSGTYFADVAATADEREARIKKLSAAYAIVDKFKREIEVED